jgi:ssDNA-binding Zn-finger/Zn-ribbon topoisomerase 1
MSAKGNIHTVSCPCGASIRVDIDEEAEAISCPECRQTLKLAVSQDPSSKRIRVGVVLSMDALLTSKGKKGQTRVPGVIADQTYKAKCTCGVLLYVDPKAVDAVQTCEACGADYTAILKRGRTPGLSTLVLMPVLAAPVAGRAKTAVAAPKPAAAPAAKPAPRTQVPKPKPSPAADAVATAARDQIILLHKGEIGAQAVEVRESGTFIACFCGKEMKLREDAHREMHKCADCGTTYRVFMAFDPRTKAPMVVTLPRAAAKT